VLHRSAFVTFKNTVWAFPSGKWHLGINNHTRDDGVFLPYHRGFDEVGHILPFSNHWACDESGRHEKEPNGKVCFLYHNTTLVQQPIDHSNLTRTIVADVNGFIERRAEDKMPWFYYMAFPQVVVVDGVGVAVDGVGMGVDGVGMDVDGVGVDGKKSILPLLLLPLLLLPLLLLPLLLLPLLLLPLLLLPLLLLPLLLLPLLLLPTVPRVHVYGYRLVEHIG
jgi:hypothetical protein